jgi:hypothetical protein
MGPRHGAAHHQKDQPVTDFTEPPSGDGSDVVSVRYAPLRARESGRFLPDHTAEKRAAVRTDYEMSSLTIDAICEKHAISHSTLHEWARNEGWVRRRPRTIDPNDLLTRMLGLLDRQMTELEIGMNNGASQASMLSKLVTTLDKVLQLKERTVEKPRSSKRVETLRAQIIERIRELNGN